MNFGQRSGLICQARHISSRHWMIYHWVKLFPRSMNVRLVWAIASLSFLYRVTPAFRGRKKLLKMLGMRLLWPEIQWLKSCVDTVSEFVEKTSLNLQGRLLLEGWQSRIMLTDSVSMILSMWASMWFFDKHEVADFERNFFDIADLFPLDCDFSNLLCT